MNVEINPVRIDQKEWKKEMTRDQYRHQHQVQRSFGLDDRILSHKNQVQEILLAHFMVVVNSWLLARRAGKFDMPLLDTQFPVLELTVEDGGGLAVVNSNWLTPRKKQVFWPPVNEQTKFNRYLKTESVNTETWILYKIRKIYYECDDLELANRKLKKAEQESDVYSSDIESQQRRPVKRPVRL
ncbi:hypothetical protein QE152_g778 [Popillia japonica]|uniref:Uncharacterized protein n=1 Tax=Popillia japonica TaxID=7064 RepID=A0AAW1N4X8_POPJA